MDLRKTLKLVHQLFEDNGLDHSLIGGLGLACYGSSRSTIDLDLLIHEDNRDLAKQVLEHNGFKIEYESKEVIQFSGLGYVDLLIARRPVSQQILKDSNINGPEGIKFAKAEALIGLKIQAYKNDPSREFQDKADIQWLIQNQANLDWELIKSYADLFDEWKIINEIKTRTKS